MCEKFIIEGNIKKYHIKEILNDNTYKTRFLLTNNTAIFFPKNNQDICGTGFSVGIFDGEGIKIDSSQIKKIIFIYSDRKQKHIEFLNYIVNF